MKKTLQLAFAAMAWLAVLAASSARAWTYQDGDALLIFRESGFNDVEFDIGSVNQFLGQSNGYTTAVTGWDSSLVLSNFSAWSGVSVIVASTTRSSAWLSSSSSVTSVNDVTASTFLSSYYDIIDAVGARPTNDNEIAAETNAYVIQPSGDTTQGHSSLASYDYIVTGGGVSDASIAELGGNVPFDVEGVAPATFGFWEILSSRPPIPAATYVGTFTIDTNGNLTFVAGPLQVPIVGPEIAVYNGTTNISNGQASPVNFGSVIVNQAGPTLTFTVTNAGGQTLDLTNINVPPGFALDTNFPTAIAAGSNGTFSVQLITSNMGTFSGDIYVTNNATGLTGSTFSFAVTGTVEPTASQIEVLNGTTSISNGQTSPVSFGSVLLNQTGPTVTFTVANTGGQTLDLSNISVPAGFALNTNYPSTLASGSNGTFSVQLITSNTGTVFGNVSITDNDTNNNPFVFAITGTVAPYYTIALSALPTNGGTVGGGGNFATGSTNSVTATPANGYLFANWTLGGIAVSTSANYTFVLSSNETLVANFVQNLSPEIEVLNGTNLIGNAQTNPVSFGAVLQNQPASNVTFTVSNTGVEPLILTNITVPAGFALDTNSPATITHLPFTIAASSNGTFSVQLLSNLIGSYSGNISITNNAAGNNPFLVPVTGQVSGRIAALGGNLSFGVVSVGSSAQSVLTISNAGNSTLNVSNLIYPFPAVFGGNFSGAIAAGQTQRVTVTFSPAAAADYGGVLTVISDATSGANTLPIAAFGANSNLLLTIITNGDGTVTPNDAKVIKQGTKVTLRAVAGSGSVFSSWSGSTNSTNNPLTFVMEESTIVQANFISNPFLPFVGTYNGLFTAADGNVTETNAGLLKGLTVTSKGGYSGAVLINGETKSISGNFDVTGVTSKTILLGGTAGNVELALTLSSNNPAPQVIGTVTGNGWVATNLVADRATNTTISAAYTLLIEPDTNAASSPGGYGYALITGSSGTAKTPASAKIAGSLADGTAFSQTASVSLDGYVPVYASLYSGKGLLLGWINLTNASGAALSWVHPAVKSGLFTTEFTSANQVLLSPWTNPPASSALPTNLDVVVDITGGAPVATNDFTFTITNGTLKFGEATGSTPLSGSIATKTGLLQVTIGSGESKTTGYGVVLLNGTNGGGYFLTKTNAAAILLQP